MPERALEDGRVRSRSLYGGGSETGAVRSRRRSAVRPWRSVSGEAGTPASHTHKAGMRASGDDERHAVLRDLCVAVLAALVVVRRQERRRHGEARKLPRAHCASTAARGAELPSRLHHPSTRRSYEQRR
jgi:hypothetical protein